MKTLIVTGASSGIGAEIVRSASLGGWQVLMVARNLEKLHQLAKENENCLPMACDLTQPEAIKSLADSLREYDISALVNNAGIYQPSSMTDDTDEVWERHFNVNLMSAVRLTRALWTQLKKNKASIVNISSTLAVRPIANTVAYSALKAAMNNWTQSLAIEGAPDGIRANCVCPGIIETPIHGFHNSDKPEDKELLEALQQAQPLGRTGQVTDIAPAVLHLCDKSSSWTTGTVLNIDGGILLNS